MPRKSQKCDGWTNKHSLLFSATTQLNLLEIFNWSSNHQKASSSNLLRCGLKTTKHVGWYLQPFKNYFQAKCRDTNLYLFIFLLSAFLFTTIAMRMLPFQLCLFSFPQNKLLNVRCLFLSFEMRNVHHWWAARRFKAAFTACD